MRRTSVVVLLAMVAGGCGSSGRAGPLGELYADAPGVNVCLPRQPGQSATFGVLDVDDPTDGTLTLNKLTFKQRDGVTLLGSVVARASLPLVAAGRGYPPTRVADDVWDQTRSVEGAEIDETELISVGLRLDRRHGSASTVIIDYTVDDHAYRVEVDHTYRMAAKC